MLAVANPFLLVLVATSGCSGAHQGYCSEGAAIVGGAAATQYPEAVLVDMYQGGGLAAKCSGVVIAPSVVMTAGHCVDGYDGWSVFAPYAGRPRVTSSSGATFDWADESPSSVNPDHHDVGLVFLDAPIALPSYPTIAAAPQPDGTAVVNLGRIRDGALSDSDAFVSAPVVLSDGSDDGYPLDYSASDVIEHGDSGGPSELTDGSHTVVAVSSGVDGSGEVLARVDLVSDWIGAQLAAHTDGDAAPPVARGGSDGTRALPRHSLGGAAGPCARW